MVVLAGRPGGAERWTTTPRAYAALIRAGAQPATARAWVAAAAVQHGRPRRGPRPGYLPVWLAADLVHVARRLAAGETLEELDEESETNGW